MQLELDKTSGIPIGEQLEAQIKLLVETGGLTPNELLPTVKALASTLGVNANTVAAAYRTLAAQGYLVQRRRAGTRVAERPPLDARQVLAAHLTADFAQTARRLNVDVTEAARLLVAQAALRTRASPLRVAVLAATPLQASILAEQAQVLLGERFACVPQTPEVFNSSDYHLVIVAMELAGELQETYRHRENRIPPYEPGWQPSAEFPAGAD
jgi:DNA-binding transcriptional regulator YhcF (GntR family)